MSLTKKETSTFWHAPDIGDLELLRANFITHQFPRHFHEGYVMGVIERGVEAFHYRGAIHYAPAGSIVVINPGEVHTGFAGDASGWTYRMLYPSVDLIREIDTQMTGRNRDLPAFPEPVIRDRELALRLQQLHRILGESGTALRRQTLFMETVSLLLRCHGDRRIPLQAAKPEPRAVKQVRDRLETGFEQNISLRELSNLTGLSPFHLTRVFRNATGLPPHGYLSQVRIQQAKTLLSRGMPPARVAFETGFADQSHLTRQFKRFTGVTPGHFSSL
jgi:AraC-like DNA-binding protein